MYIKTKYHYKWHPTKNNKVVIIDDKVFSLRLKIWLKKNIFMTRLLTFFFSLSLCNSFRNIVRHSIQKRLKSLVIYSNGFYAFHIFYSSMFYSMEKFCHTPNCAAYKKSRGNKSISINLPATTFAFFPSCHQTKRFWCFIDMARAFYSNIFFFFVQMCVLPFCIDSSVH